MTRTRLAYVNARMRARKARLLDRDDLVRLAATDNPTALVSGWRDLGTDDGAAALLGIVYGRLVDEYTMALRACPDARAALLALVRLHEVENVKLVWRAIVRRCGVDEWIESWRPLDGLATVSLDASRAAATLRGFVEQLARTPYGAIAATVARAHPADVGAAELAFDRWSAAELGRVCETVSPWDRAARDLLPLASVRRDEAARARRRKACRRALHGDPYSLAPLLAYLLLRDAEARALLSVAEARAQRLDAADVRRALDAVM